MTEWLSGRCLRPGSLEDISKRDEAETQAVDSFVNNASSYVLLLFFALSLFGVKEMKEVYFVFCFVC